MDVNDTIDELKEYLIHIGYDKKKLESCKILNENYLRNLIIKEIKEKDKIFRDSFFNKTKIEKNWNNLINILNDN